MKELLDYEIFSLGRIHITVVSIVSIIVAIVVAKLAVFLFFKAFSRYATRRKIDRGRENSIYQIVKYLIYFFTAIYILYSQNVGLSGFAIGSGALLVGVGIGLQQTFNDFFSGIILLFEGSVKIHDKLVIEPDIICQVNKIGLRTTDVTTLDNINIIIPNSHLVVNKVTNWSHNRKASRFHIDVGVSYSSDIDLVENVLLKSLQGQEGVERYPSPSVQLMNYGDSSVDFRLFFFSTDFFTTQRIKSDIRKRIFKNFREVGIEIPFPQRDLWVKNIPEKA